MSTSKLADGPFLKRFVIACAVVPGALLALDAYHHNLGVNDVNYAIRSTGMLGLVFLSLSLLVTSDTRRPRAFAVVFVALMIFRVVRHELDLRKELRAARTKVLPPKSVTTAKKKFWSGELVVARIFQETHDTRTFRFVVPDGG